MTAKFFWQILYWQGRELQIHECRKLELQEPDDLIIWSHKHNSALFICKEKQGINIQQVDFCPFCGRKLLPTFLFY